MEWKLFQGEFSEYASPEWYQDREAAHHLEEDGHKERIEKTLYFIKSAIKLGGNTVVDLGCGDGGLLSLLKDRNIKSWGYDLCPSNIAYATKERNVDARYTNFQKNSIIEYADIGVLTEVLEHLETPHQVLKDLPVKFLIASSPYNENDKKHYKFHLWAWDIEGYKNMIQSTGYKILKHDLVSDWCQVVLAEKNN